MDYKNLLVVVLAFSLLLEANGHFRLKLNKDNEDPKLQNQDFTPVQKRNLIQFALMVTCATGRFALDYNNYGNFCGLGGSGIPVDGVDRCCQAHDMCYGDNGSLKCLPKLVTYSMSTSGKYPTCSITCNDTADECKEAVCTCDKVASECFAKYEYNEENKHD